VHPAAGDRDGGVGAVFGTVAWFALGAGLFGIGERSASAVGVVALAGVGERFVADMV
jgi:hypothetical protein